MSYVSKGEIVRLWYKTQMGNIHTCREKQLVCLRNFLNSLPFLDKELGEKE